MKTAVDIQGLYFGYNEDLILKNINLSIDKGDFISIIGPNGSGKSTLLRNISSVLKPTKGIIKIDGKELKNYNTKELARKLAFVPQDTSIVYDFSVFDIVLMGRSPYLGRFEREKKKDFEITKEALIMTDTFQFQDRSITEISGGERQRVIVARALAQEPEILLLDEPTSHLDINHQIEILHLLKRLNKEKGMTIIVVIHDINLASRFSNKVILMKSGQILSKGTPEQVITKENIKEAYGINIMISKCHYSDGLYVIPIIEKHKKHPSTKKRIHIICGGGTGSELIRQLDINGFNLSIGVLNIGDSDWELGRKLSLNLIEEMPFSPITERAFSENIKAIEESEAIILTSIPYGSGNLRNLESAYHGMKIGKPTYLLDNYDRYEKYDYVEGKAEGILNAMKKMGLKVFKSIDMLIDSL
jgi:iron complex transport system ATP-binding protein